MLLSLSYKKFVLVNADLALNLLSNGSICFFTNDRPHNAALSIVLQKHLL